MGKCIFRLGRMCAGKTWYIIQSTARSCDGKGEWSMMANRRGSPNDKRCQKSKRRKNKIDNSVFWLFKARQKNQSREPVSASDTAQMLMDAGADSILTMDISFARNRRFNKESIDILYGNAVLLPAARRLSFGYD